jgi:protein LSM14
VAPQEGIHAYLMFRGCDIKDLHVHEQQDAAEASDRAPVAAAAAPPPLQEERPTAKAPPQAPPASDLPAPPQQSPTATAPAGTRTEVATAGPTVSGEARGKGKENQHGSTSGARSSSKRGRGGMQVGTGASLLNRTARGSVQGGMSIFFGIDMIRCRSMRINSLTIMFVIGTGPESPEGEFDFQAKLDEFEKGPDSAKEEQDEAGDEVTGDSNNYYDKDDFFDSISCDALDKQNGIDNRLRGKEERNLNTETFGAFALNSQRRHRGRGGGRGNYGRGRGGRGRGRGRGRGGRPGGGRGGGQYKNTSENNRNSNGRSNSSNNKAPVQPSAGS